MATGPVGSPITPQGVADLLRIDFRKIHYEVGQERPREYTFWINVDTLDYADPIDKQFAGLGIMMEKPPGTRFPVDSPQAGGTKTWTVRPYGKAVEMVYEAQRDAQYGLLETLVEQMARQGRYREELDAHSVLNNGFDTGFTGYTSGEALFGNHTSIDGTVVQRNRPGTVAVPIDLGFGVTFLQSAVLHFHALQNERGNLELAAPSLVLINAANLFAAREILGSAGKPFTADNEINSLVEENLSWMVSHFLTSTTASFVLAPKGVHDLWFMWRDMPSFDMFDDPWTRGAVASHYQRHSRGEFGSWRGVYGSTG